MTIKTIYKIEGDPNEYDSEQEAQVAEAIGVEEGLYCGARDTFKIAKAITKRYFLCPILPTVTVQVMNAALTEADEAGKEAA